MAIDWNFIREVEGFRTDVYVPQENNKPLDKSGPTVGSGVDLGQMSEADLNKLDISNSLKEKLKPYLKGNYPKDNVIQYVEEENPLSLTKEEAAEITEAVKKREKNNVENWYNKNNKVGQTFADLSDREQTVIASVGFQYGSSFKDVDKFASYVLNDDWAKVTDELYAFNDKYESRRHKELNYLVGSDVKPDVTPDTLRRMESFVQNKQSQGPSRLFSQSMEAREGPTMATVQGPQESTQDAVKPFIDNLTEYLSQQLNGSPRGSQEPQQGDTEPEEGESQFTEAEEKLIGVISQGLEPRPDNRIRTEREARLEREANEAKLAATARAAQAEAQESAETQAVSDSKKETKFTPEEERMINKMFKGQAREEAPEEEGFDQPVQMLF